VIVNQNGQKANDFAMTPIKNEISRNKIIDILALLEQEIFIKI